MKPYTYLIGWPDLNRWYYGVRYAKNCDPTDLWNPYKTSSSAVKSFIKEHGDPTVRVIRRTFTNSQLARNWESRVLHRLKVISNSKWLNQTDNLAIQPRYGKDHPHYGKTGPAHHCYGDKSPMKKTESRERARRNMLSLGKSHWWCDPDFIARRVASHSGDNHHMKRPEVSDKVSGKNNWIYQKPGALEKRRQQFIEKNKARTGTHYKRVLCQYCAKDYSVVQIKQHEKRCSSNLISFVGNTGKDV